MQKKGNLWMADWRDQHGRRYRQGFKTKRAAQHHTAKMLKLAAAKKAPASAASPTS